MYEAFRPTRVSGTAAGTTLVLGRAGQFARVIVPATRTGTASFYDSSTAAGTTAGNFLFAVANTTGSIPTSIEAGFRVKDGLAVVVGGTTDFTVVAG